MNREHKDPKPNKAIVAGVVSALGLLITFFAGYETIDRETVIMLITGIVATSGVWLTPNHSKDEVTRR